MSVSMNSMYNVAMYINIREYVRIIYAYVCQ